jgi:hypothetical protein
MNKSSAIISLFSELAGAAVILHLWSHVPKLSLGRRLIWSLLLMVPVLGLAFYFFLCEEPEPHGENKQTDGASGWSEGP